MPGVGEYNLENTSNDQSDPESPMNVESTTRTTITKNGESYSPTYRNKADADQVPTTPNQGLPNGEKPNTSSWPGN
jgi:hypothetical protein